MWRPLALTAALLAASAPASANDCFCPTVPANGKGNTSCSTSESGGRCTVDYNLFTPAAEQRAGQLLLEGGMKQLNQPSPGLNTILNLMELSDKGGTNLVDAVLVYLTVATADRILDGTGGVPPEAARDIVNVVTPHRDKIEIAFAGANMRQWLETPTEKLPPNPAQYGLINTFEGNKLTLAPGCIEVRTNNIWAMFKASWSPMRIKPRCTGG